jgi:dTDP-4-amino-4,6-dideoxygalactose transaminase
MALTNNAELADRMARLRTHGITRDPAQMTHEADGPWYYQQIELGFNYRMTDIQAALGVTQLQRLEEYVARREALAARCDRLLADLPVRTPYRDPRQRSALHLYPIQIAAPGGLDRGTIFRALREAGIGVNVHYIPVHTQPDYQRLGFSVGDFPESESYYAQAISLPMFPTMTEPQQDHVIATLKAALV